MLGENRNRISIATVAVMRLIQLANPKQRCGIGAFISSYDWRGLGLGVGLDVLKRRWSLDLAWPNYSRNDKLFS